MPDDTVRSRMGWAEPGEDLSYKTRLVKYGQWPPGSGTRPPGSGVERPSTPYLCIPATPHDVGERESADASWIENGSLMLVAPDWTIEVAPRLGVSYRILAFVRNLGDAPALSAFVEFRIVGPPLLPSGDMGHNPQPEGDYMGVAALSIGSRETSWALSPGTWTPSDGHFHAGLCIAARVIEPSASNVEVWSAWSDRHVGLRNLAPDLSGAWFGTETEPVVEGAPPPPVIGAVHLSLDVAWPLQAAGGPNPADAFVRPRECVMTVLGLSPFGGRQVPVGTRLSTRFEYGALGFEMPVPGRPDATRFLYLEMQSDEEISFVTLVRIQGTPGQQDRTEAVLRRTAPGSPAPGVDPELLRSLNLAVGPLAPASRREEAARLKAIRGP